VIGVPNIGLGLRSQSSLWTPERWGTDRIEDWTADDVLTTGANVTAWVGKRGINWAQANAAYQGTLVSHTPLGGRAAVRMTNDHYTAIITYAGTSHSVFVVCHQDSAAATDQFLVDTESGRSFLGLRTPVSNTYYIFNNGAKWPLGGGAVPGADSLCSISDGTNLYLYRAGVLLGSQLGGGTVAVQIGGTTALGANYPNTGGPCPDVYVARVCFLARAATNTDRANWFEWSLRYYGV